MTNWRSIEKYPYPPARTPLVFRCVNEKYYTGDMCYGMHEPWFCTHNLGGSETIVLNDSMFGVVTHWTTKKELDEEVLGPQDSC